MRLHLLMVSASAAVPGLYPEGVQVAEDVTEEESPPRPASAPSLDTNVEPWLGIFPGWGRVEVWADGSYKVSADSLGDGALETIEQREAALTYGWAELLSSARRGVPRVSGMTLGMAEQETCALFMGEAGDTGRLMRPLLDVGFAVLADRPAPVHWDGSTLIAETCQRPVVMGCKRAESAGLVGSPIRGDTDACAVEVPRVEEPRRIAAIVLVGTRRPHELPFEIHTGHRSFEYAANVLASGLLDPKLAAALVREDDDATEPDPAEVSERMTQHVWIASLPIARLLYQPDDLAETFDSALPWLREVLSS